MYSLKYAAENEVSNDIQSTMAIHLHLKRRSVSFSESESLFALLLRVRQGKYSLCRAIIVLEEMTLVTRYNIMISNFRLL
jgi:hypothetical protein